MKQFGSETLHLWSSAARLSRHLETFHTAERSIKCDHVSQTREELNQHVTRHDENQNSSDLVSNNEDNKINSSTNEALLMVINLAEDSTSKEEVADADDHITENVPKNSQQTISRKRKCKPGNKKLSLRWKKKSEDRFVCEHCTEGSVRRFNTSRDLYRHVGAIHHLDRQGNKLERTIKCSTCEFTFYSVYQLKEHMTKKKHGPSKNMHVVKKSRFLKCDKCDFSCSSDSRLSHHLETFHAADGIFKCNECELVSNTREELDQHLEQHNGNQDPVRLEIGPSSAWRERHLLVVALTHSIDVAGNPNDSTSCRAVEDVIENEKADKNEDDEVETGAENEVDKVENSSSSQVRDSVMNKDEIEDKDSDKMEDDDQDEDYLPKKLPKSYYSKINLSKFERFGLSRSGTEKRKVCKHCSFRCNNEWEMAKHLAERHELNCLGHKLPRRFKCQLCNFSCVAMFLLREHEFNGHSGTYQLQSTTSTLEEPTSNLEPTSPQANPIHYETANADSWILNDVLKVNENGDSSEMDLSGATILAQVKDGKITNSSMDFNCKSCSYSCNFNHCNLESVSGSESEPNNSEEVIKCPKCNFVCYTMVRVNNPTSELHISEASEFKCDKCDYLCFSQNFLSRHQTRSHPPNLVCQECGAISKELSSMNAHMRRHNSGKMLYRCHLCPVTMPKYYKYKSALMTHLEQMHQQPYANVIDLADDHNRNNVEAQNISQMVPGKVRIFVLKNRSLVSREMSYKCRRCSRRFELQRALDRHLVSIHHVDSQGNKLKKNLKCPNCSFKCYSMYQLNRHRRVIHCDQSPLLKCDKCHFVCRTYAQLSSHEDTFHSTNGTFKCNKCDHVSHSRYELDQHVTQHDDNRNSD